MALEITATANDRAQQTVVEPSLVLEIDGIDTLYGAVVIQKFIRIGDDDLYIGDDWVIGGYNEVDNQSDLISLDGTTTQIKQQLLQDKGGTGSVSSMQISLIDKDGEATELITPGFVVEEIMGRKARVWLSFQNTAWPEDYAIIFQGVIDEITADAKITLNIASPEQKKRQEIFTKISTALDGAVDNSQTTITLDSVAGFLTPVPLEGLKTYVRIDDELMEYTAINVGLNQLTVDRAELDTIADSHDDEAAVESFYRLQGDAIDIALKVMMSGMDGPWVEDLPVNAFVRVDPITDIPNAICFDTDIRVKHGLEIGDLVTTTGAGNGANNVSEAVVTSFVEFGSGLAVIVSGASLVVETGTSAVAAFRSQYDVLGHGVAMGGDEVDVAEFHRISDFFTASIPDYDFYLKESVKANDFIDTQILFPMSAYSIPRKGRVSLGMTGPPVAIADLPALNAREVVAPNKTQIKRSVGKFFYNTIVYRFEENELDDRFLAGRITIDADSKNRIPLGTKPLTIVAKGLRDENDTVDIIDRNAERLLERYKFAAESFKIQVQYGVGYKIEVGDVVLYGDESLLLPDTKYGTRAFQPRLMEVFNKTLNIKTGQVDLELVDTNYLTNGRYGIFSPASVVGVGSTTSTVIVTDSFGLDEVKIEADKWRGYLGSNVMIRDENWTYQYFTRLVGISNANPYLFQIDPIAYTPIPGDILDIVQYSNSPDPQTDQLLKVLHCFFTPRVTITAGVSNFEFTVSAGDIGKFVVGQPVLVHDEQFTVVSPEAIVDSISGNNVLVVQDLGFTPTAGQVADLIGLSSDQGSPYRFL